jgi:Skp family chaperone for outer membrane proteins
MNTQAQVWMPAVFSLFGTLIVVVFTAWFNTRALSAQIDALRSEYRAEMQALRAEMTGKIDSLRAEMKQSMAELELRISQQIADLTRRLERLEEARTLVRP